MVPEVLVLKPLKWDSFKASLNLESIPCLSIQTSILRLMGKFRLMRRCLFSDP